MSSQRPAPQFRSRHSKAQRSRRWLYGAIAALAVLVGVTGVVLAVVLDDGDGDASAEPEGPESTGGTAGGREPVLPGGAGKYTIQTGDVATGYKTNGNETYAVSAIGFASLGYFQRPTEGEQTAIDWGYAGGYRVSYEPDGQLAGVLQGRYYVDVQTYLFETVQGAKSAFTHIDGQSRDQSGSVREEMAPLANQSSSYSFLSSTIASSDTLSKFHRVITRRGNLVTVIQTFGAETFMTIDRGRDLAVVVDEKALGERPAPEPTPAPATSIPGLPAASPTP